MQADTYKTIAQPYEGLYKEKGSKFIAYAYPVESVEQAISYVDESKKKYHTARHHCWAYRIGYKGEQYRANDDGEPTNSAGKPILGQIDAFSVTQILIIVVRYFGGTLLGVGGLIQAYKEAAKDALSSAKICTKHIPYFVSITCNYKDYPFVIENISQNNGKIISEDYAENCSLVCEVTKQNYEQLTLLATQYSSMNVKLT